MTDPNKGNDLISDLRAGITNDVPVVGLIFDSIHSGQTDPPGAIIRDRFGGDRMARAMQARGEGFYTIGSSGHEGMAAVAAAQDPPEASA